MSDIFSEALNPQQPFEADECTHRRDCGSEGRGAWPGPHRRCMRAVVGLKPGPSQCRRTAQPALARSQGRWFCGHLCAAASERGRWDFASAAARLKGLQLPSLWISPERLLKSQQGSPGSPASGRPAVSGPPGRWGSRLTSMPGPLALWAQALGTCQAWRSGVSSHAPPTPTDAIKEKRGDADGVGARTGLVDHFLFDVGAGMAEVGLERRPLGGITRLLPDEKPGGTR